VNAVTARLEEERTASRHAAQHAQTELDEFVALHEEEAKRLHDELERSSEQLAQATVGLRQKEIAEQRLAIVEADLTAHSERAGEARSALTRERDSAMERVAELEGLVASERLDGETRVRELETDREGARAKVVELEAALKRASELAAGTEAALITERRVAAEEVATARAAEEAQRAASESGLADLESRLASEREAAQQRTAELESILNEVRDQTEAGRQPIFGQEAPAGASEHARALTQELTSAHRRIEATEAELQTMRAEVERTVREMEAQRAMLGTHSPQEQPPTPAQDRQLVALALEDARAEISARQLLLSVAQANAADLSDRVQDLEGMLVGGG